MSDEWSREELAAIKAEWPMEYEQLVVERDGVAIPLLSKAEVQALIARYPTNFQRPPAPPAGATEEERALRARYPSM